MKNETSSDPAPRAAIEGTIVRHRIYGAAIPDMNWVPAPRYLLRRDRVLRLFDHLPRGEILEIGCGSGALLDDLVKRGFRATGVDRSPHARRLALQLHPVGGKTPILEQPDPADLARFDYLCAFEILEHIQDDLGTLRAWRGFLADGGRLLLSVPAHPERWDASDEWAGHVRRYHRRGLAETVEAAGFTIEHIECYGFPLANLAEIFRARACARQIGGNKQATLNIEDCTDRSGADRRLESRLWPIFSSWPAALAILAACQLQRLFLSTDLGNGYIVVAKKS